MQENEAMVSAKRVHARSQGFRAPAGILALSLCFLSGAPAPLRAQTADPIVLIQDAQGRAVFMNPEVKAAPRPASAEPSARAARAKASGATLRARQTPAELEALVEQTASRHRVDPALVNAIIRVESEFDPRAVSNKGAMGLMQLMPATADRLGVENPFDPGQNIRGGVTYLRWLLDRFNGSIPLSLAAYNAGENRVARHGGIPNIPETVDYVRKVSAIYRAGAAATREATPAQDESISSFVDRYGVLHFTN
ncbi:MAG: lytic transglycosylase domain-containing protein [Terriglobia bacterium]